MVKLTCPSGVDGNDEVIECKRLIGDVAYWPQAAVDGCVGALALLWQIFDFVAFYRIPESIFQ
jgi:hypothetical protein